MEVGFDLLGVSESFTGVDCELSARELRDEDLGVMFEFTKCVTGVTLSSGNDLVVWSLGVVCAGLRLACEAGGVYPASLGAGEERVACAEAARRGMSGLAEPVVFASLRFVYDDMISDVVAVFI